MRSTLLPALAAATLLFTIPAKAQLEVAHIQERGFSATGLGGFFNVGIPVSDAASVTAELGLYTFSSSDDHVIMMPILAGYRYTLDQTGSGFYIEPSLGYTIGATDIERTDKNGQIIYGENAVEEQKASGISSGVGFGYLFQPAGRLVFNVGLRYLHVFPMNGDPQPNQFSLRVSHSFSFGRRSDYY